MVFKNEDYLQLREYLTKLINDDQYREKIAEKGKEKALHNFTEEIMVNKTLALYQRMLD
jgi:glycosyltransferase involved in cell wall biosynthesis